VYNAEGTIEKCLESLLAQETDIPFEIVVADSSSDSTPEIIERRFPSIRLIRLGKRTFPGPARNAAIREARGDLISMIDADCIAEPDLLERIVARHDEEHYIAVGGAICNGTPNSPSGIIGYLLEFREFVPTSPRRQVITIPTANICYRREAFERYGYFEDVAPAASMKLLPRHCPDWRVQGARPASAAICLRPSRPSWGISAIKVRAITGPMLADP
jgi:glycosyltransferase involved in cell wall biosynthesis